MAEGMDLKTIILISVLSSGGVGTVGGVAATYLGVAAPAKANASEAELMGGDCRGRLDECIEKLMKCASGSADVGEDEVVANMSYDPPNLEESWEKRSE
jgi:hypothetical protein